MVSRRATATESTEIQIWSAALRCHTKPKRLAGNFPGRRVGRDRFPRIGEGQGFTIDLRRALAGSAAGYRLEPPLPRVNERRTYKRSFAPLVPDYRMWSV